ncbi:MAG: hypothetical protein HQ477_05975 [Chloroflexi bacterium]|nr:hypothetical protein [Chloroflexota bacterium]
MPMLYLLLREVEGDSGRQPSSRLTSLGGVGSVSYDTTVFSGLDVISPVDSFVVEISEDVDPFSN